LEWTGKWGGGKLYKWTGKHVCGVQALGEGREVGQQAFKSDQQNKSHVI